MNEINAKMAMLELLPKSIDSIECVERIFISGNDNWISREPVFIKSYENDEVPVRNEFSFPDDEFSSAPKDLPYEYEVFPVETSLYEFLEHRGYSFEMPSRALTCNRIETIGDLVYLSMNDLVLLTGKHRTDLYDYQAALMHIGLNLGFHALGVALYRTNYLIRSEGIKNEILRNFNDVKKASEVLQQAFVSSYYEEVQIEKQIKEMMEEIRETEESLARSRKQ